jgi:N-glycosylase/DNA lyase
MVDFKQTDHGIFIANPSYFSLADTFECGQCFRWQKTADGYEGIAYGRYLRICEHDGGILLCDIDTTEFDEIWRNYFDLNSDYAAYAACIMEADPTMADAFNHAPGIRLLRAEPWETICSFIISANNNIPRIKGIITRLCQLAEVPALRGGYAFPSADIVARFTEDDLAVLRCGYRSAYILDAARKISSGEIDIDNIRTLPYEQAKKSLMQIKGVGSKVADCALLFAFGKGCAVPADVWMKRVIADDYGGKIPDGLGDLAGLWQQYLFHFKRTASRL